MTEHDMMPKVYHIPFTQYMRPDGRAVKQNFNTEDHDLWSAALRLIHKHGLRYEAEILTTGQVSLTIVDDDSDTGDIDIEVVSNGPDVPEAFKRMVDRVTARMNAASDLT